MEKLIKEKPFSKRVGNQRTPRTTFMERYLKSWPLMKCEKREANGNPCALHLVTTFCDNLTAEKHDKTWRTSSILSINCHVFGVNEHHEMNVRSLQNRRSRVRTLLPLPNISDIEIQI